MRCFAVRNLNRQVAALAPVVFNGLRFNASKPEGAKAEPEIDLPKCEKTVKITQLEAQLKESQAKIAELKNDVMYQAAETENVRRIGREDGEKARNFGIQSFSKDMLEVVDTLERGVEAFDKLPKAELESKSIASIYTGVKMSANVLLKNLSKHGVEKMSVKPGDAFDPNRHEALFKSPVTAEVKADQISNVLKSGYLLKERVLRAAQVGVAEEQ
jgi:molecular chaperone GrpE